MVVGSSPMPSSEIHPPERTTRVAAITATGAPLISRAQSTLPPAARLTAASALPSGFDERVGPHLLGQPEPVPVAVDGHHPPGAAGLGHGNRRAADGPASEDRHRRAPHLSVGAGVDGVAERLHGRGHGRADGVSDGPDVGGRDDCPAGEAAVSVDTEDAGVGADVEVAAPARRTAAADDVGTDGDPLADGDPAVDAGTEGDHLAAQFVADDPGGIGPWTGPRVPVVEVDIGAAHGRGDDPE